MRLRYTISLHRIGSQFSRKTLSGDGEGDHLDWFFQTDQRRDAPLSTWATRLNAIVLGSIQGTRLPAHRSRYLDFWGEISGQRGHVQPLVTGFYQPLAMDPQRFRFRWHAAAVVLPAARATLPDPVLELRTELMKSLAHRLEGIDSAEILSTAPSETSPDDATVQRG